MALPEYPFISVEDYFLLDSSSKGIRYEYMNGELWMLAGGSNAHSTISIRLSSVIEQHLENSPCLPYSSDVYLQISESCYFHPDIAVSCDSRDHEAEDAIQYPCLVVETLSPGTERRDRGVKFAIYQECLSIQEYALVDSLSIRVEVYRREDDGWKLHTYTSGDTVKLESISLEFPIERIYRGTKVPEGRKKRRK